MSPGLDKLRQVAMLVMCYELHITNIGTFNFKTINTTPSLCCDNSFHFFSGRWDGSFPLDVRKWMQEFSPIQIQEHVRALVLGIGA